MTQYEFVEFHLKKKIEKMGTVKAAAQWIKCSPQYLHLVIQGKAAPGKRILDAFNVERVVDIRRKR